MQYKFDFFITFMVLKLGIETNVFPSVTFKYSGPTKLLGVHNDKNQRTNGPVKAHLISWPTKAQNIQNLENIW